LIDCRQLVGQPCGKACPEQHMGWGWVSGVHGATPYEAFDMQLLWATSNMSGDNSSSKGVRPPLVTICPATLSASPATSAGCHSIPQC
jgi:hypothetical protein